MVKEKFREFKNYILSSGIPLEVYISNLLAKHGWIILEEIPFYFENKMTKEFEKSTTEIIGRDFIKLWDKKNKTPDIQFDVNVECKYRAPSTSWIFFGSRPALDYAQTISGTQSQIEVRDYMPSHIPTFYPAKSREQKNKGFDLYQCIEETITKHLSDFTPASRVLQIPGEWNKKFSRAVILDTFEQVMKSSVNWRETNILGELMPTSIHPFISIIFPCVVTNSKMLYFENVDIDLVQKLKVDNSEVAYKEVKKVIFLYQIPKNLQFKQKFFDPISYIFIPVISHDSFITEIEKLRKKLHRIEQLKT